jgi:predicted peptidase
MPDSREETGARKTFRCSPPFEASQAWWSSAILWIRRCHDAETDAMKPVLALFTALLFALPTAVAAQQAPRWVLPEVDAPGMQRVIFHSQAAGENVSCYVFTPQLYDVDQVRRFPVLYWLHGSGGSSPAAAAQLARRYAEAMHTGKIPPMILVFPNGLPRGMWCDWKDGSVKLETMLIEELIPHLDNAFRTQATREGRIIEGFSMGGYGAARLGFRHPHLFAAVSLLGAGPLQAELTEGNWGFYRTALTQDKPLPPGDHSRTISAGGLQR